MKTLFGIGLLLAGVSAASARPQLHTESIGWIEKSELGLPGTPPVPRAFETDVSINTAAPPAGGSR
jgi:hypothetical protein